MLVLAKYVITCAFKRLKITQQIIKKFCSSQPHCLLSQHDHPKVAITMVQQTPGNKS